MANCSICGKHAISGHVVHDECLNRVTPERIMVLLALEKEVDGLKRFKAYWDSLYGQGLRIADWHMNGALEPFDSFHDSAEAELQEGSSSK